MLFRGAMPGAEVQRVVRVDSISGPCESALLRHRIHHGEKLILTVETAVGGVCAIGGTLHLVRVYEFMMDSEGADEFVNGGAVLRRKAGGKRGDGKRALVECALRGPSQVSRVRSSGERNDARAGVGTACEQRTFFFLRLNTRSLGNAHSNARRP